MKTLFSAVILVLLLLNAPAVDACSCAGYPAVCESYRSADAVFIGVVQSVNPNKVKDLKGREYIGEQVAHIQVEKSFKGMAWPNQKLSFVPKELRATQLCFKKSEMMIGSGQYCPR
jgi:hypothetical protein